MPEVQRVPEVPQVLVRKVPRVLVPKVPKGLPRSPRDARRRRVLVLAVAALGVLGGCSAEAPTRDEVSPVSGSAARAMTGGPIVDLPKQAGPWVGPDSPRRVTADTIFDYMNGGGELYLAYRFNHLDVLEYKAADPALGTILVEIYQMQSSDDAFGLLSGDWGGETIDLRAASPAASTGGSLDFSRALYGAGLLRLWSGDLYARVLASRETPSSREQVLALGRSIAAGRDAGGAPAILEQVAMPAGWSLRPDRLVFFRSHLVLNSAYFLASGDILGLGPDVEGVTAECLARQPGERPIRLIVVRYPAAERASGAVRSFREAYLPEAAPVGEAADEGSAHVEQGWVAFRRNGTVLAIALDAATRDAALAFVRAQR